MKRFAILGLVCLLWFQSDWSAAVPPSDTLLPPTTKGYLSIPDIDAFESSFQDTQLAKLLDDPLMQPFFDDLRDQLEQRLVRSENPLNIRLEDLRKICGGEVCVAMIQPDGDEKQHASVVLADITDREDEANELLDRLASELKIRKAVRRVEKIGEIELVSYTLPLQEGATDSQQAFYFVKDRLLVAADHEATIKLILQNTTRTFGDRLADLQPYQVTMQRCADAASDVPPHVRWFVEPFGYVQATRAAAGGRRRRGTDMITVLANQGFSAVQGIGGHVNFSVDGQDLLHRTYVYAPPTSQTEQRYELAARMLDFPNQSELSPEPWIPGGVATYLSFHWNMKDAFEYSKSLVDEVAGAPVFEDILESLERDPNGPQINVRQGLVQHLGDRVVFFADYRLPITIDSERWAIAFQVTGPAVVAKTLDQAMEADPDATLRLIDKQRVWEIQREFDEMEFEELDIAGVGFGGFDEEDEEEPAPLLENAAMTVVHGYLLVASHLDFMEEILQTQNEAAHLAETEDFQRVQRRLAALDAGIGSGRFFSRTDRAYHTTYELIREGQMPESKTMLGVVLNRMLGPEERGVVRDQRIPGQRLPEFDEIRHYFGPAGIYVASEDHGWYICGCILPPQADDVEDADVISQQDAADEEQDGAEDPDDGQDGDEAQDEAQAQDQDEDTETVNHDG